MNEKSGAPWYGSQLGDALHFKYGSAKNWQNQQKEFQNFFALCFTKIWICGWPPPLLTYNVCKYQDCSGTLVPNRHSHYWWPMVTLGSVKIGLIANISISDGTFCSYFFYKSATRNGFSNCSWQRKVINQLDDPGFRHTWGGWFICMCTVSTVLEMLPVERLVLPLPWIDCPVSPNSLSYFPTYFEWVKGS